MRHTSFQLPTKYSGISDIAYTALQFAALSSRLALEDRTLVKHITGRTENVAEHSHMLSLVAPAIAEQYYPQLDPHLISRFATIHDAVEAYVGDTTTHNITEEGLKQKRQREITGLERLRQNFAGFPAFINLVNQYEDQILPEARFVRVVDKWTPVLVHFADQGATVRGYTNPTKLLENYRPYAERLYHQFPDFRELVAVREELTALVAEHLFKTDNTG